MDLSESMGFSCLKDTTFLDKPLALLALNTHFPIPVLL